MGEITNILPFMPSILQPKFSFNMNEEHEDLFYYKHILPQGTTSVPKL